MRIYNEDIEVMRAVFGKMCAKKEHSGVPIDKSDFYEEANYSLYKAAVNFEASNGELQKGISNEERDKYFALRRKYIYGAIRNSLIDLMRKSVTSNKVFVQLNDVAMETTAMTTSTDDDLDSNFSAITGIYKQLRGRSGGACKIILKEACDPSPQLEKYYEAEKEKAKFAKSVGINWAPRGGSFQRAITYLYGIHRQNFYRLVRIAKKYTCKSSFGLASCDV
jgi:hypothetical protein